MPLRQLLVAFCCGFLAIGFSLVPSRAQSPEELGLKATHFRAPDFPEPEANVPQAGGLGPQAAPVGAGARSAGGVSNPAPASEGGELGGPETPAVSWINSQPLTLAQLRSKVVLIDFWEYTCINCIRTFAENKKWYERYHKYGFEIIGVHDPEFDIAYPVEHVRVAAKRFGLPYPVVVDDSFKIWASYNNNTWPNRFLIDGQGFVRYNRPGEGADRGFEVAIQRLLQEAHPGLTFPASYALPPIENAFAPNCGIPTSEMYVGDWDGRGSLANPEGYHRRKTVNYKHTGEVKDGAAAVSGPWETDRNGMIYRGKRKKGSPGEDRLEMRYHAREIYAVMNVSHAHASKLFLQQDGKDLTAPDKGADVQIDAEGHSYIEVREPRMYYLVQNPSFAEHTLTLLPTAPGLTINSFTFGNDCQTQFPHL